MDGVTRHHFTSVHWLQAFLLLSPSWLDEPAGPMAPISTKNCDWMVGHHPTDLAFFGFDVRENKTGSTFSELLKNCGVQITPPFRAFLSILTSTIEKDNERKSSFKSWKLGVKLKRMSLSNMARHFTNPALRKISVRKISPYSSLPIDHACQSSVFLQQNERFKTVGDFSICERFRSHGWSSGWQISKQQSINRAYRRVTFTWCQVKEQKVSQTTKAKNNWS